MNDRATNSFHLQNDFAWDIFLSHASLDNQAPEGQEGWISHIDGLLRQYIGGKISRDLRSFLDRRRLSGNTSLDEILPKVRSSAVFVAFISNAYVDLRRTPNWCQNEANEFYQYASQHQISAHVERESRIYKILLSSVTRDSQNPEYLRNIIEQPHCQFYGKDLDEREVELRHDLEENIKRKLYTKVNKIAIELAEILNSMENKLASLNTPGDSEERSQVENLEPSKKSGITVYLAETTSDLEDQHFSLKHELEEKGYNVLSGILPLTRKYLIEEKITGCLQVASIFIQLVGKEYGVIPEGAEKSLPVLQNDLAATHSRLHPDFLRFVWMPPNLHIEDSRQEEFAGSLQDSLNEFGHGMDLSRTPFEEFKYFALTKLEELSRPVPSEKTPQNTGSNALKIRRIYLLYDKLDQEHISQIKNYLDSFDNLEVLEPIIAQEDDPISSAELRAHHENWLKLSDAVLIYWGHSRKSWLQMKQSELIKNTNMRSSPFLAQAIYLGEPLTPEKSSLKSKEFSIIRGLDSAFGQFLSQIVGE
jgi:hypothetical protein